MLMVLVVGHKSHAAQLDKAVLIRRKDDACVMLAQYSTTESAKLALFKIINDGNILVLFYLVGFEFNHADH
jgi:hypothetical protein